MQHSILRIWLSSIKKAEKESRTGSYLRSFIRSAYLNSGLIILMFGLRRPNNSPKVDRLKEGLPLGKCLKQAKKRVLSHGIIFIVRSLILKIPESFKVDPSRRNPMISIHRAAVCS